MSEESESPGTPSQGPNAGYKKGLPLDGLAEAEAAAAKLWAIARLGMASQDAYAVQLGGTKASGGAWRQRLATLRGFKLVNTEGDRIGLTSLGQAMVNSSNPAVQTDARRTALLALKSYADLVASFEGTELPGVEVLATRLQYEYGKAPEFAQKAARSFIDSLRHADMINSNNIVDRHGAVPVGEADGEKADAVASFEGDGSSNSLAEADATATELDQAYAAESPAIDQAEIRSAEDVRAKNAIGSVSIAVTLDLSNFTADEVVQILGSLKGL